MKLLIPGGAGYIGSHMVRYAQEHGHEVVVLDDFSTGHEWAIKDCEILRVDLLDQDKLAQLLKGRSFDGVIHFAAKSLVGESVQKPDLYYRNNVVGTLNLINEMINNDIHNLVFSSTAAIFGNPVTEKIAEDHPKNPINPYGQSKLMVEKVIADLCSSDPSWSITALRYFNPVGAHASGLMGEDPQGIPNNLMPFLAQVAVGRREELQVFGNDYQTPDGTGVRDYIHVIDLAQGHLSALTHGHSKAGHHIFNLGTGKGNSVLEMLNAFGKACGKELKHKIVSRRPGDVAASWADPHKAQSVLNWKAQKSLDDMCQDTWRWQSQNPNGYP